MPLSVGEPAPAFTLSDQHGEPISLIEFKSRNVVLYFYPKADSLLDITQ